MSRGSGMTVDIAAALVKRVQNAICLSGQEELLEHISLGLTEQEFDEVCADYQYGEQRREDIRVNPGVGMLILGMPILIRRMR